MKVYKIIFSPTGGTAKVAGLLTDTFGEDEETVDLSDAAFSGCSLDDGSVAVIAIPSFGGRAPKTAIDRLSTVRGNGAKAVIVAVYGNREQDDTLIEMYDAAKECGFVVIAGITAVAEHSIAHQYGAGRPDNQDAEQLKNFVEQIKEKMRAGTISELHLPGNRPYKKAGAGLVPRGTSACVNCGLCAAKCPVAAIDKANPKHTDKNLCINCMRCVSICPHKARKVNKLMVSVVGMALKKACTVRKDNQLFM